MHDIHVMSPGNLGPVTLEPIDVNLRFCVSERKCLPINLEVSFSSGHIWG